MLVDLPGQLQLQCILEHRLDVLCKPLIRRHVRNVLRNLIAPMKLWLNIDDASVCIETLFYFCFDYLVTTAALESVIIF